MPSCTIFRLSNQHDISRMQVPGAARGGHCCRDNMDGAGGVVHLDCANLPRAEPFTAAAGAQAGPVAADLRSVSVAG